MVWFLRPLTCLSFAPPQVAVVMHKSNQDGSRISEVEADSSALYSNTREPELNWYLSFILVLPPVSLTFMPICHQFPSAILDSKMFVQIFTQNVQSRKGHIFDFF